MYMTFHHLYLHHKSLIHSSFESLEPQSVLHCFEGNDISDSENSSVHFTFGQLSRTQDEMKEKI